MNVRNTLLAAAFALLSVAALAAQPPAAKAPSPEEMKQIMATTLGAMVPVMGQMTEAMLEAQLRVAARPETAERLAAFKKNLYEALLKQGFNGADAMQITIATSPPSAAPSAK